MKDSFVKGFGTTLGVFCAITVLGFILNQKDTIKKEESEEGES